MATIINFNGKQIAGTETFLARGIETEAKPIWAGLEGFKNFDHHLTMQECLKEIGADYQVQKQRLIRIPDEVYDAIMTGDDTASLLLSMRDVINTHVATINATDDITLGVVGSDYGVVQNSEAFRFIDFLTHGDCAVKPVIETAGVLDGGRRVFVTAKMPRQFKINGDSGIDDYIVFHNSHDGSCAVSVCITPIRVICANTLAAALRSANKLTFKHTKYVDVRMRDEERAKQVLKLHEKYSAEFVESLQFMQAVNVTPAETLEFACRMFIDNKLMCEVRKHNYNLEMVADLSTRAKNQVYELLKAIESGIGQQENRGTRLWLYNGLTTYFNNSMNWGGAKDTAAERAEKKFNSIFDGTAAKKTQAAYEYLLAV